MGAVKVIFGLLVVIIVGVLVTGWYLVGGMTSPRDLGITYTKQDKASAYLKNGVVATTLPAVNDITKSVRYEGKKEVKFTMSSSEITAIVNGNNWQYSPISKVQIKIYPDGSGEASGILHVDKILPFVSLTHSTAEVKEAMEKYHISANPPFYLKGRVSITNNQVSMVPSEVQIGRISVPSSLVSSNLSTANGFAEERIRAVPNLYIRTLKLDQNGVSFDGTMPEKEIKSVQ